MEKRNKILIAGATGFIGKNLADYLVKKGYKLHILTRNEQLSDSENISFFQWDLKQNFIDDNAFKEVDVVINLTGANISEKRWTQKRKQEILDSRIDSVNLLYESIQKNKNSIHTFISSSAVGYYGSVTRNDVFKETSSQGTDFLAEVCQKWEKSALKWEELGIRTIILRKGVLIGKNGGMYQKLAPLAKRGINIALGNGKQSLPWMDIRDLVRLYDFILQNKEISGIYNAVSTEVITMNEFSKKMIQSFGKKSFLPNVPKFIIQIALGEMSALVLEGTPVSNQKLRNIGFELKYDEIEKSLQL